MNASNVLTPSRPGTSHIELLRTLIEVNDSIYNEGFARNFLRTELVTSTKELPVDTCCVRRQAKLDITLKSADPDKWALYLANLMLREDQAWKTSVDYAADAPKVGGVFTALSLNSYLDFLKGSGRPAIHLVASSCFLRLLDQDVSFSENFTPSLDASAGLYGTYKDIPVRTDVFRPEYAHVLDEGDLYLITENSGILNRKAFPKISFTSSGDIQLIESVSLGISRGTVTWIDVTRNCK